MISLAAGMNTRWHILTVPVICEWGGCNLTIKCFMIERRGGGWVRSITGEDVGKSRWDFPVGAMWWNDSSNRRLGFTGQCLHVKCHNEPLCIWNIDGQAYKDGKHYGSGWQRTG